jgi:protein arginine kinase activator
MLCQSCESKPATIHITTIEDTAKTTLDLCEDCANEKGVTDGSPTPSLLATLVGPKKAAESDVKCPECGITFEEFRAKGRLGCPRDYEVFAKELAPLLEKIHGAKQHVGRRPSSAVPDPATEERLRGLRRDLARAVKDEQYESAARLRDEIRVAEEALRGPR